MVQNLGGKAKIGYDPRLLTAANVAVRTKFFEEKSIEFLPIENNLVDEIWEGKPGVSKNEVNF